MRTFIFTFSRKLDKNYFPSSRLLGSDYITRDPTISRIEIPLHTRAFVSSLQHTTQTGGQFRLHHLSCLPDDLISRRTELNNMYTILLTQQHLKLMLLLIISGRTHYYYNEQSWKFNKCSRGNSGCRYHLCSYSEFCSVQFKTKIVIMPVVVVPINWFDTRSDMVLRRSANDW